MGHESLNQGIARADEILLGIDQITCGAGAKLLFERLLLQAELGTFDVVF